MQNLQLATLTFPLITTATSPSLFQAIFQGIERQSPEKRPELFSLIQAVDELVQTSSIFPGKVAELIKGVKHLYPCQLEDRDRKILYLFIKKIVVGEERENCNTPTLIQALAQLKIDERPPLSELLQRSMNLIALADLQCDEISTWDFWLRGLYPQSAFGDLDPVVAERFETMTLLNLPMVKQEALPSHLFQSPSPLDRGSDTSYLKLTALCCKSPANERLHFALFSRPRSSREEIAKSHQLLLNALMAEKNLCEQVQEIIQSVCDQMEIDRNSIKDIGEIVSLMWQTDKELLKISRAIERAKSSEEFALILLIHRQLSEIQIRHQVSSAKMRHYQHRKVLMERSFGQMQTIKEMLEQVERADSMAHLPMMAKLAQRLARYVDTLKAKLICAHISDSIGNLFQSIEKSLFPHLERWQMIAPALCAGLEFLNCRSSIQSALLICSQILKLYGQIEVSQEELYNLAFAKLRESINQHQPRRALMSYSKLLIDIPPLALASALPSTYRTPPIEKSKKNGLSNSRSPSPSKKGKKKTEQKIGAVHLGVPPKDPSRRSESSTPSPLPGGEFPFPYHDRVSRWHGAACPLNQEAFPEYALKDERYQMAMIEQHRFSTLADRFYNCGIALSCKNAVDETHQRFILPAELNFNATVKRGVIIWSVNAKGICYHRFFHPKRAQEVFQTIVFQTFKDADFPELLKCQQMDHHICMGQIWDQEGRIDYDPLLRIATIFKNQSSCRLRLFLVSAPLEKSPAQL